MLAEYRKSVDNIKWLRWEGHVRTASGLTLECMGVNPKIGELCQIISQDTSRILCEVVGIQDKTSILMPLNSLEGIGYGDRVIPLGHPLTVNVGPFLTGTILNGFGKPIDPNTVLPAGKELPVTASCPNPLDRPPINEVFTTGIRAIDCLLTCGKGQRIGIFAGSGVGKSTLLGNLARNSEAEVVVLALIGERGREVKSFIKDCLGKKGLAKSVLVVATSDTSPIERLKGVMTALTIAEYYRDEGKSVLFLCDSITRAAMAIREVGLARKEPPTLRGYPPSLYANLSKMVERLGNTPQGSITGIFTVLVEGDDFNEPVADTMRGLLDGHAILTRELAQKGHFPSIDILQSVSRIMNEIVSAKQRRVAERFRLLYHTYRKSQELIDIGAYKSGANPLIDEAIMRIGDMDDFLRQELDETCSFQNGMEKLFASLGETVPDSDGAVK